MLNFKYHLFSSGLAIAVHCLLFQICLGILILCLAFLLHPFDLDTKAVFLMLQAISSQAILGTNSPSVEFASALAVKFSQSTSEIVSQQVQHVCKLRVCGIMHCIPQNVDELNTSMSINDPYGYKSSSSHINLCKALSTLSAKWVLLRSMQRRPFSGSGEDACPTNGTKPLPLYDAALNSTECQKPKDKHLSSVRS
ncbi:hypothetical protein UY3_07279 [Chelonia mydas]|uniref:Uncharacterized protein n=1 Tax=Chelonia mydas TaxID=8469 RepID=M7BEF4_CHEMY|nr:hypothetical protein UY3_07279 [Chelonia mydas]